MGIGHSSHPAQFAGFGPFHAAFAPAAVPAQRYHRSGATAPPFRRNGITVPAQRHPRSGATASPFRRNGITVPAQRGARSSFYAINKLRGATKAPPTFRHSLRPPRLYPLVGAAVPCRPSRPQPKGRDRSPLPPAPPLPTGRGGSPLPPVAPLPPGRGGSPLPPVAPLRPRNGLSKSCSPMFGSGTCEAPGEALAKPFVAPRSFFSFFYILYTVNYPVRGARDCPPPTIGWSTAPSLHSLL